MISRKFSALALGLALSLSACASSSHDAETATPSATATTAPSGTASPEVTPSAPSTQASGEKASAAAFEESMMNIAKAALAKNPQEKTEIPEAMVKIVIKCIASKAYDGLSADLVNHVAAGDMPDDVSQADQEVIRSAFAQCSPGGSGK
ncbi:hypothetical protein QEV65_05335 [Trueperella pyogenes]|uniref:hypothetical protein n=1 Tax=Trueperella pyogenes TaxID=1661 RepID=UPI0032492B8B